MSKFDYTKSDVLMHGEFIPFNSANLSIASSSILYGLSIYTVFSANWNHQNQQLYLFRLHDHYKRVVNSSKIMGFENFELICSYNKFEKLMIELLKRNNVKEDALVRVTLFIDELIAGTKISGLKNSWSAFVYPFGEILNQSGINVCVSSWTRSSDNSIPPRAKVNGNYVNSSLMKNEALLNGYDDAIALDKSGRVSESTVANLFFVKDGRLYTPDPSKDILEGITRNTILSLAEYLKIPHSQRPVDRTELYIADEMFLCGSSARIAPILSVDRRKIGDGILGPVTKKLANSLIQTQRDEITVNNSWLTKVY